MNIFTIDRRPLLVWLLLWLTLAAAGPLAAQDEPPSTEEPPAGATTELSPTTTEPAATPTPLPRPGDIRFGVVESYEDPAAAARLGAAWTRVRFQWADVQPGGPRDWEPPLDDDALAAELDAGREVVGLLIGIPHWARDGRGLPRGFALPPDAPGNTWAAFVDAAVSRYAGRIDRWIIWNEPDIADPGALGHTWDGDMEQFFQLQRTAYLAAKAANPDAQVHLSAFTYFWDPGYFDRFLDIVAADPNAAAHNHYFDVATAHLYFQPDAIYTILDTYRRALDSHSLEQPLWLVETNAPPMDDPYWPVSNWTLAVTLNEQAAFVPQALAAAFAGGAERVALYKLKDTAGDRAANPEPFGLIRWDNSRRPAFDTYRVAIRLLGGITAAERERWDAVGQVWLGQDGQSTTVLFARLPAPQQAVVGATAETAELIDMWGNRETIEVRNGVFEVELPGALCRQTIADYCMIGGTTYYLIQKGEGRPAAAQPTPTEAAPTAPATATTEPTPESTSTTEPTPMPQPSPTAAPAITPVTVHTATPPAATLEEAAATTSSGLPVGLVLIGAGVVLALGLAVWWVAGRGGRVGQ